MRIRHSTPLAALVLLAACNESVVVPRGPLGPVPNPPTPIPMELHRITGVVRTTNGLPIEAAAVTGSSFTNTVEPAIAFTDAMGSYDVTMQVPKGVTYFSLAATKEGFERNVQYPTGTTRDFWLKEIVKIALGAATDVTVGPDDALSGLADEYRNAIVRVTSDVNATAEVTVVAHDGLGAMVQVGRRSCCGSTHVFEMAAGSEVEVRVLVPWDIETPRSFTVTASRVR